MDYRNLLRQHVETNADLTIATVEHPLEEASHFGVVEVDGSFRVNGFKEKPADPRPLPTDPSRALVSMGIYAGLLGSDKLTEIAGAMKECRVNMTEEDQETER
jgi:ADP-glucose pyrophosphorylase